MDRQRAHYQVVIHRAEDVPRMDSGLMASVKKAINLTSSAFVDAYVEVSFVGLKVRNYEQEYNNIFKRLQFIKCIQQGLSINKN